MERFQEYLRVGYRPSSEAETIAQAEEVLGALPGWYQENRQALEKNKLEHHEWADKIGAEVRALMERLNGIRQ